jgi:hypothetical protein
VGTRTDAALEAIVAARSDFEDEVDRLEAAGRAAVDIPARVRSNPGKVAGVTAGGAFLLAGGPKRVFRRVKRVVRGKEADLPSELLPNEIEKTLRKMGTDGKAVRGTIERDFAKYLEDRRKQRQREGFTNAVTALAAIGLRPIAIRGGQRIVQRMLDPNQPGFNDQLGKIRQRTRSAVTSPGGSPGPSATPSSPGAPKDAGL